MRVGYVLRTGDLAHGADDIERLLWVHPKRAEYSGARVRGQRAATFTEFARVAVSLRLAHGFIAGVVPRIVERSGRAAGSFCDIGMSDCFVSAHGERGHADTDTKRRAEAESHRFGISGCTCGTGCSTITTEAPRDGTGATNGLSERAQGVAHDDVAGGAVK